jgi:hypothetical protein
MYREIEPPIFLELVVLTVATAGLSRGFKMFMLNSLIEFCASGPPAIAFSTSCHENHERLRVLASEKRRGPPHEENGVLNRTHMFSASPRLEGLDKRVVVEEINEAILVEIRSPRTRPSQSTPHTHHNRRSR